MGLDKYEKKFLPTFVEEIFKKSCMAAQSKKFIAN